MTNKFASLYYKPIFCYSQNLLDFNDIVTVSTGFDKNDFTESYKVLNRNLFVKKTIQKLSPEYYDYLLTYSKMCFNLRKYDEVETSLQNCTFILQEFINIGQEAILQEQINFKIAELRTIYPYFIAFSNPPEFKELFEEEQSQNQYLMLLNEEVDLTNLQQEPSQFIDIMKQYEYFHNLSVRYFQAKDHNTSLTLAYKTLSTLEGRIIQNLDDIITLFPNLCYQNILTLVHMSEVLLSSRQDHQIKCAFLILKGIKDNQTDILQEYFEPRINFLYIAYFYDRKLFDSALLLIESLINSKTHPFTDNLKVQALKIKQLIGKKNFERSKQNIIEDQINDLELRLKISNNAYSFCQFYTPLKEFFLFRREEIEGLLK